MIEIHRLMVRIVMRCINTAGNHAIHTVRAARQNVDNAGTFTALVPAAFNLMRRNRTAP